MAATKSKAKKATGGGSPALSDEQVAEVLALIKHSKTVELKVTVPEGSYRSTALALGIDALQAQLRQVVFFDTPDLALNKSGVVVRARRSQGAADDTVIKLRPVVPENLPGELRALPEFGIEVDALPGGFVCSASFKGELTKNRVRDVMLGQRPISKLFTAGRARLLCRPRAGGGRARPSLGARSAERAQAQVHARGLRPQARRRALVVPGRIADLGAVDEVST